MTRKQTPRQWRKMIESRLGRRWPKRLHRHLNSMMFIDWPHAGPQPGRQLRPFVRTAQAREAREAWKIERLNG